MKFPFLTQIFHPTFNPEGLTYTEDCGPASLAMALEYLGLEPNLPAKQTTRVFTAQGKIDRARFAMFSDSSGQPTDLAKCGYIPTDNKNQWRYHIEARQTLTNLTDIERGVANAGALSAVLSSDDILSQSKGIFIVAGDPSLPEAHGKRLDITYSGGHFVVIIPRERDVFDLLDPLCTYGPAEITTSELQAFMSVQIFGNTTGVQVSAKGDRENLTKS